MNKRAMVFLLLLAAVSTAHGARIEEDPIETRTREVSKTLRCAVCQSESVWESNSTLAKQMREIIRERVARGETVKEIQAYFVGRYGDYILLEPRKRGFNWILWIGPFILLAFGGGVLYMTLRRWVRQTAPTPPDDIAPLSESERIRVEQERVSSEE